MTHPLPIDTTFLPAQRDGADIAAYPIGADKALPVPLAQLDAAAGGLVTRALAAHPAFKAKAGDVLPLALPASAPFARALLVGVGEAPTALDHEKAGGALFAALEGAGTARVALFAGTGEAAAHLAAGFAARAWRFGQYKADKPDTPPRPQALDVVTVDADAARALWDQALAPQIAGVCTARDLISEPPNVLYPESYAQRVAALLKPLGVEVDILDEKRLDKLGMGGILGVGQGSARPPRLVILRWKGSGQGAPVALVGKGITFDTGGISIKPSAKMEEMKADMAGSAAVVGAVEALARAKSPTPVVAALALAENMPSANAYRPADILTTYAGKTVEVFNTDAEGRLVLVDALAYVQQQFSPRAVVDAATLTGAIVVALGEEYAGAFVNDDALWEGLAAASAATGEKLWRMPLDKAFRKQVESDIADLRNTGKVDRAAGSCTAAAFLEHFIEDGTPWAHLDIAGVGLFGKASSTGPKGATGFGVRLLFALAQRMGA
ncbi:MAG TPA: leucyl aminopeptidase [Rhodospirillaceae bacterium]|jgi:leucyl aminopeptidase|nr:leucyl aminopeptidase [Alphaproteobacteria bacterium]HBH26313.1 leucyl aminopeptidase [Rhodospirillaceae bacterium]